MGRTTGVRFETVFLSRNPPDDKRTNQLINWCKRLDKLGLVPKSAGNLSFRTNAGFIITATGVELKTAEKENLVEVLKVDIENGQILVYAKGQMVPSRESILHSGVYDLRPEINAVFHTHDQLVLEFASELKLPCTEGEQPSGSYELAKEVQGMLDLRKDARYLVLKNHGVIAMGKTIAEAGRLAEDMNRMAEILHKKE